jgi:N-acetylglucosamine-6-phosphate deacetylase
MKILGETDDIARWSIAPELNGALELGDELKKRGIIASVAHTEALYDDVVKAYEHGYNLMTHFYNCMMCTTKKGIYKYAGAVEAAYLLDDMYIEIIADGHHIPIELLRLAYKIKGADKIALISDALRAAGMPEGMYKIGSEKNGYDIVVEDGVAKLADRSALAGSVSCCDTLVRTMYKKAGIPLTDAIKMATMTPATILKTEKTKGSIEIGKDADIVIFDDDINVLRTIVQGETVFEKD